MRRRQRILRSPMLNETPVKLSCILNFRNICNKKLKMHLCPHFLWILKDYAEMFSKLSQNMFFILFCFLLNLVSVSADILINLGENRYL